MLLPQIIEPTGVTNSKTLIDSIFSNIFGPGPVSGNLPATVSDHLPQLATVSNIFSNPPSGKKSIIYERDWNNFDQENFVLDCLEEDWNSVTKKEGNHQSFFLRFSS